MKFFFLSALVLWQGLSQAAPSKPTVEAVLEFFHTEDYLEGTVKCMDDALARRKKEVPITDQQMQNLTSLSHRIYPASNLYKSFKLAYTKATTIENLTAVYNWMNTPKGLKFGTGFNNAYKATPAQRESYHKKQSPVLLKPNRQNALGTFITNWQQDGLEALTQTQCDFGVLMGMNGYQPAASRDKTRYLKEKVVRKRSGFIEKAREQLIIFDFYLLKEMKNEEVDDLSKFATSSVGQGHAKAYGKAMEIVLDGAAKTLMDQVIKPTK